MKRIVVFALVLNAALLGVVAHQLVAIAGGGAGATRNGDTNGDGARDIGDAIYLLQWLFVGGEEPAEIVCPVDQGDRVAELEARLAAANTVIENLQREAGDPGGCDLSGMGLEGARLAGVNLADANLRGTDLGGADLLHANLAGAVLANASLGGANLWRANLTGADLAEAVDVAESDGLGAAYEHGGSISKGADKILRHWLQAALIHGCCVLRSNAAPALALARCSSSSRSFLCCVLFLSSMF